MTEERVHDMLEISLRQLETFAVTVEQASFTRAAEKLHLTQSTVSTHIQSLEEELGVQLILRGARRRFALTEDGKRVYNAAKDILARCEALQEMRKDSEHEMLHIGTSTVPAQYLLPKLMAGFLKRNAGTRYTLRRGDSDAVRNMLEKGEVRMGLLGAAPDDRRFVSYPIARDRLVLITENSERFRKMREAGANGLELLGEPMIAREESSGTQQSVENYLAAKSVSTENLSIVARMDNPETVKTGVSQGLGIAIISALAVQEELALGRLVAFDLDNEGVYRTIYLAWRRDVALTAFEQRFVNYVRSEAQKIL
ncbi:MAG: LysR family transcriptional regulator [Clostridiales bacterium]|nr:LysR family transcriptional regulator [Clostridiales bacterium]